MSREILFRGKRLDNGEWIRGSIICSAKNERAFILPSNTEAFVPADKNVICSCHCYEVDPDTVCQYIGLTDKNGHKFFENDIVKNTLFGKNAMAICFVECAFCLVNAKREFLADIHYLHHAGVNDTKIVGNVFDNPDLLKEE